MKPTTQDVVVFADGRCETCGRRYGWRTLIKPPCPHCQAKRDRAKARADAHALSKALSRNAADEWAELWARATPEQRAAYNEGQAAQHNSPAGTTAVRAAMTRTVSGNLGWFVRGFEDAKVAASTAS